MDGTYLTKLTARHYYLLKLKSLGLVSPSIGVPYPKDPANEEEIIMHNGRLSIQHLRCNKIMNKINELKNGNFATDNILLDNMKQRFNIKISNLVSKYKPSEPVKNEQRKVKMKIKNKKSRSRYMARKIRKKIYNYNREQNNVINLSSQTLSMAQMFALGLGSGYVLTPTHADKEEETLILEGLRVIDKIGKIDSKITYEMNRDNNEVETNAIENFVIENFGDDELDETFHGFTNEEERFVRPTDIPNFLISSQPTERKMDQSVTKLLNKEFQEFNNGLIERVRSKPKRKLCNQPKIIRDAILELNKLAKDKKIDIRKVDKGPLIVVIDYEQRTLIEQDNIELISEQCAVQKSNWEENRIYVDEKMKTLYKLKFVERKELATVTGILAGGVSGELKVKGSDELKFTRAIDSNELFAQQKAAYVYPLLY